MQEILERVFFLQQVGNSIAAELRLLVVSLFEGLERDMRRYDPTAVQARYRIGRRDALMLRVRDRVKDALPRWRRMVKGELARLGRHQAVMVRRSLIATLGTVIDDELAVEVPITEQRMRAILNAEPFQGRTLNGQVQRLGANVVDRVGVQVRLGMAREESIDDIVRRVRGRRAGRGFVGGVMQATTREAEALVRTAVTFTSNRGILDTLRANADVLDGVRYVATLDDRTCFAAGTGVLTPGGYRPIEEVRPGDTVVGGTGRERRVVATRSVKKTAMANVVLSDGSVVTCTADHLWLTNNQRWVEARNLTPGVALARRLRGEAALRDLRNRVRGAARPSLLLDAVLPHRAEVRRLHWHARDEGPVRSLRSGAHSHEEQEAGRLASGPPVLLMGLLSGRAHETGALDLLRVRCREDAHEAPGGATEILSSGVSRRTQTPRADQLPGVWRALHADTDSAEVRPGRLQERPHDLFAGVLHEVGERGRRAEAQDQRSVHGRPASELDGWPVRDRAQPPRARMVEDRSEGAQARRLPLHRVREVAEGRGATALRPPHRAVPQLRDGAAGESHEQPAHALPVLSHDDRAPDQRAADGASAQPHVIAAETYWHATTVYDIQVEVDHSFIVAGVVVHNSDICLALDGTEWELDDPDTVIPGEATHYNCRSVLVGIPAYERLGLTPPPVPDRVVRDLSSVSDEALDRPVRARRRRGEFGDVTRISSSQSATAWLRGQRPAVQNRLLGRGRAALFREGKVTLKELVTSDFRTVSLKELMDG